MVCDVNPNGLVATISGARIRSSIELVLSDSLEHLHVTPQWLQNPSASHALQQNSGRRPRVTRVFVLILNANIDAALRLPFRNQIYCFDRPANRATRSFFDLPLFVEARIDGAYGAPTRICQDSPGGPCPSASQSAPFSTISKRRTAVSGDTFRALSPPL
jgi:hypothetical protein